jgi:RimJ/RimL family protein N-acetyltransferase
MEESDRSEVLKLELQKHQHAYVSPVSNILKKLESRPQTRPYLIRNNGDLIGYVQINTKQEDIAHYCDDDKTLGLEGFFLDHRVQGQGLGVPAIEATISKLPFDYPDYDKVALTVNCKNTAAIRTYKKGGFEPTGELYHGGRSGPQYIMVAGFKDLNYYYR